MLTVVGDDRVGLVKALADVVAGNGGNWERSHLAELAGTFAGVVLVTVPDRQADRLRAALAPLEGLLDVAVRTTDAQTEPREERRRVRLDLLGNDRPGIVAAYGAAFGEAEINIAGMQIARTSAGGDALSIITIDQVAPDELVEQVGAAIEATTIRQIGIRPL